jgi:dihydrofolate synthase/folylpolyglutamate synthase
VSSFRERIKINGEMISMQKVVDYSDEVFDVVDKEKLDVTFFEIVTLIALLHYRDNAVDYAVMECGLGGRRDATNILERVSCAAITSIGNDHADVIGPELSDIAYEKSGIIKKGVKRCVLGPTCIPFDVFATTCDSVGCETFSIDGVD